MKRAGKVLVYVAVVLVLVIALAAAVVMARWDRTFDAPYPDIQASSDPAVIEKGRYIVYGPGHCVACHSSPEERDSVVAGATPPLAGGSVFSLPLGDFHMPNLTPDRETGIGRRSDRELARILRHGVRHDGRAALPFMEAQNISDEDLVAVISYLRAQPPVRRAVPEHEITFMGKTVLAFLIRPVGPSGRPPKASPPQEATIERGAYLANSLAACGSCHTRRSMVDGSYQNARFSGGGMMPLDSDPTLMTVTPNLTPEPKTGRIAAWSEEQFVGRFQVGMGIEGTHMPWKPYSRMTETDLRAIYRYLKSLQPVENATGPSVQKRES